MFKDKEKEKLKEDLWKARKKNRRLVLLINHIKGRSEPLHNLNQRYNSTQLAIPMDSFVEEVNRAFPKTEGAKKNAKKA